MKVIEARNIKLTRTIINYAVFSIKIPVNTANYFHTKLEEYSNFPYFYLFP